MTEIDLLDQHPYIDDIQAVIDWMDNARVEIKHLRYCHGDVSRMLTDAARFIDEQNKKISELQSDVDLFIDLCDKKDEWLQYYRERVEAVEVSTPSRLEKKLQATEQVLADLIVKCERHACSGNKEGEKFFDPLEKQELIQKLTEIDDE